MQMICTCCRVAIFATWLVCLPASLGQAPERLEKEREAFERKARQLRDAVITRLTAQLRDAERISAADQVVQLKAELRDFESGSMVPSAAAQCEKLERHAREGLPALRRSYEQHIERLERAGRSEDAAALQTELSELEDAHGQMLEWAPVLYRAQPAMPGARGEFAWDGAAVVKRAGGPGLLRLPEPLATTQDYDLRLVIERAGGGAGKLQLLFVGGGDHGGVELDAPADGEQRVTRFLTVAPLKASSAAHVGEAVIPEHTEVELTLAVRRDWVKLTADEDTVVEWRAADGALKLPQNVRKSKKAAIMLLADADAALRVRSAHVRRIAREPAAAAQRGAGAAQQVDPWAEGTTWSVKYAELLPNKSQGAATIKVIAREGRKATLEITIDVEAVYMWTGFTRGTQFHATQFEEVQAARNAGRAKRTYLEMDCQARLSGKSITVVYTGRVGIPKTGKDVQLGGLEGIQNIRAELKGKRSD